MTGRKTNLIIRKSHRYLGIFIGIQFLLWTISGLYFSWNNIDDIHGDQFINTEIKRPSFTGLISPNNISSDIEITSVEMRDIAGKPHYWINGMHLFNAINGDEIHEITREDAIGIANKYVRPELKMIEVDRITETNKHHEYRGKPLPAYVISYETPEAIKAYISARDGTFQRVRHRAWRWFDFLWMTHTMDYEGRDNFNTLVLRSFSVLGLITVLSGFILWYVSSPTLIRLKKNKLTK